GAAYDAFKAWDVGDIIGAGGVLFRTKTNELSVRVDSVRLLVKSLRPLPDKWHGLADTETRYRQRYVDLIVNERSRETLRTRARIIRWLRDFLDANDFLEVETPMMQPIPGGAAAKPFVTHHNALDLALYLRIAPELYLKRLVVGGFERVFEINRNFRNEGISVRHNPEFTMMEFYCAYWDHRDVMDFTERLIRQAAIRACGSAQLLYQGREIDFGAPFERLSVRDAVARHAGLLQAQLDDPQALREALRAAGEPAPAHWGVPELQFGVFEALVEDKLWQPTYIVDYPIEVSPLARASDADPSVAERFELFISGREIANGFSELNDPEDQAARFAAQVANKDAGDEEAMYFDADYIRALEVGMPPAGGCGIGIDRLVMLLTDA
ncbi:MAG: lysine--tRNA ligase, partial [Acidobacteriota bacterium]|nr:lysine--tRNA ligase [Acidobacteriota bacterium]